LTLALRQRFLGKKVGERLLVDALALQYPDQQRSGRCPRTALRPI